LPLVYLFRDYQAESLFAEQVIQPIPAHFSIMWSVVCDIRGPCLNRLADAIS